MRRLHGSLSGCRGLQAVSHQDVVGEGEPAQGGVDLGQAAHGEPGEAPLPKARIDAFAHGAALVDGLAVRSEEHTSELQSLMRISYAVLCLKKKNTNYKKAHPKP